MLHRPIVELSAVGVDCSDANPLLSRLAETRFRRLRGFICVELPEPGPLMELRCGKGPGSGLSFVLGPR